MVKRLQKIVAGESTAAETPPPADDRMGDTDALLWRLERDPLLRTPAAALMLFDRTPDRARLRQRAIRLSLLEPRLRQIVADPGVPGAMPRFVPAQDFNIDYHLHWIGVPEGGDLRDVLDLGARQHMTDYDRARPLWELIVVTGLPGGKAALLGRIHHALTDALGGLRIFQPLFDAESDAGEPEGDLAEPESAASAGVITAVTRSALASTGRLVRQMSGLLEQGAQQGLGAMKSPLAALRQWSDRATSLATELRAFEPSPGPLSPLLQGRSLNRRFDLTVVPIASLKTASAVVGAKLNDALVAGLLIGLRRYHLTQGDVPDELSMMMPVNLRSASDKQQDGNHFVTLNLRLPLGQAKGPALMQGVRKVVDKGLASPAMNFVANAAKVVNLLPVMVGIALAKKMNPGADFIVSNVPGPAMPLYVAGARIEQFYMFGPLVYAAANITALSYNGAVHLAVQTDPAAIADAPAFLRCLQEGFEELLHVPQSRTAKTAPQAAAKTVKAAPRKLRKAPARRRAAAA